MIQRVIGDATVPRRRFGVAGATLVAFFGLACLPLSAQVQDTSQYLQRMDANGDGRIDVDEYVGWMMYAFDRMDADGDGVLSAAEQPGGRGKPITREQQRRTLVERFAKQDANRDGFLSAAELAAPPR